MDHISLQIVFILFTSVTHLYGATIKPPATQAPANESSWGNRSSMSEVQKMLSCTFDDGFCSWILNDDTDIKAFNWTRHFGPTITADTGPDFDHTLGNNTGYYVYIESSSPQDVGQYAKLSSPTIDTWNSNYLCFTMWYHAYGKNLGDLIIYQNQTQFLNKNTVLWSFQSVNVSSANWREVKISIMPTGPFKIVIKGIVGDGFEGDIAIDDINILPGKCPIEKTATPVPTPVPTTVSTTVSTRVTTRDTKPSGNLLVG
ncbi:hypothetical protein ACF0H5_011591 [Mactra antiquata]